MTRTARAAYPRAVIKDRSESRTGTYDMARKSGAGQHNWGSLADERQLESAALDDARLDEAAGEEPAPAVDLASSTSSVQSASPPAKPAMARSASSGMTPAELEQARLFRKTALKGANDRPHSHRTHLGGGRRRAAPRHPKLN
ncbi:hypothetical protein HYPSUDRAFT_39429 [Hypholoma sublateritium FD-334 SS-4]|uniref:Hyaluronan/mRNA-binding protein domain-containing protein n=1 Tax=Hypholoma sublateritium (strain FD-334 SS-4) TaxID=945553 RepID=A0A0D2NYV8_HYPSF|nr:hypothetical protein HYPSUDRAFT_39429 [Hypholoma sublateritium FD-334 SS-4]